MPTSVNSFSQGKLVRTENGQHLSRSIEVQGRLPVSGGTGREPSLFSICGEG